MIDSTLTNQDKEIEVLEAADSLVSAFSRHNHDAYFACFSPGATFMFHNMGRILECRAEYEKEWKSWEENDQFQVISCISSGRNVQVADNAAVFTHFVATSVKTKLGVQSSHERETIVFAQNANTLEPARCLGN